MTANPQGRNLRIQTVLILGWGILLAAALWLRIGALEGRPMHADEAVQGMIFADLLEEGRYAYDPRHYHGPSLYYLTLPVALARGERNAGQLDELTLRMVPFLFGLILAAAPLVLRKELRLPGVMVATGFLLLSPGMVYFSGYYIQEMVLLAGLGWFLVCSWRWMEDGLAGWAVGAGLAGGLMLASKENAPLLMFLAWAVLLGLRRFHPGEGSERPTLRPVHLGAAAVSLLVVAVPLYSSFGQNPGGLLDAVRAWFVYETGAGHDKPWFYYLTLLSGWSRSPLRLAGEAGLLLAALLATIVLFARGGSGVVRSLGRFGILYSFLLLGLLSLVSYKTPWLVLVVLPGLAMAAGCGFSLAWKRWPGPASRGIILGLLGICWLGSFREAVWATRTMPADDRNSYAYVHTSWDLPRLAERIHRISHGDGPAVKIMADEYWPLPWYLRDLDRVGYWHHLPEDPYAPVMVVGAGLAGGLDPERLQDYQFEIRGLRPGKLLLVYVRRDLWNAYIGLTD